jgi:hypothetical protein
MAVEGNSNGVASIVILRQHRSPTAVGLAVISITVRTIYGKTFRRFPHVFEEVFECQPAIADCDAASAVVLVIVVFWISAPRQHVSPNDIDPAFAADRVAVFQSTFGHKLRPETSAAFAQSMNEIVL